MAKLTNKFSAHLPEIWDAIEGQTDMRSSNQKLYKKIYKYYKHAGVIFTGDSDMDYNVIINYLYEDAS